VTRRAKDLESQHDFSRATRATQDGFGSCLPKPYGCMTGK